MTCLQNSILELSWLGHPYISCLCSDARGNNSEMDVLIQKIYLGMFSGIMFLKQSWQQDWTEGRGGAEKFGMEALADLTENSGLLMCHQRCLKLMQRNQVFISLC